MQLVINISTFTQ